LRSQSNRPVCSKYPEWTWRCFTPAKRLAILKRDLLFPGQRPPFTAHARAPAASRRSPHPAWPRPVVGERNRHARSARRCRRSPGSASPGPPVVKFRFLVIDRDVADAAATRLHEFFALHEHAARASARVVNSALVGCKHPDQHAHDMSGGMERAAFLALGAGELRQKIRVDAQGCRERRRPGCRGRCC